MLDAGIKMKKTQTSRGIHMFEFNAVEFVNAIHNLRSSESYAITGLPCLYFLKQLQKQKCNTPRKAIKLRTVFDRNTRNCAFPKFSF